ncbi:TPA: helix-turn-helix domain-containing protein [Staphylococcus aureus]|uniref:helix-turn-helix domain-containing protein n=1 Tax=Staphylococcus agnetis TaxID=985762 RepID=UPI000D02D255|nr:helix-turn-helix transcriptional regulator [Staphylococcus agnetis]
MNLGKQIKENRKKLNLSQEDISKRLFVSRQTISNWENGRSYPDVQNLLLLGDLFDISLDDLVKGDLEIMEKRIADSLMSRYTKIMLIFIALAAFSIGPSLAYLKGYLSFIPPLILWLIGMYGALKLEKLKKDVNIKTYKEIKAFMESKDTTKTMHDESKVKDIIIEASIIISFCLLALLITLISIFLF